MHKLLIIKFLTTKNNGTQTNIKSSKSSKWNEWNAMEQNQFLKVPDVKN